MNSPCDHIDPTGMMTLLSVTSTISNIGRAFIKYYPILRVGLIVADILAVTNIVLKAITQGISSVTVGEWAELAIITATAFFGGKIARRVAKVLIRRALGIPAGAIRSFKVFSKFVKSKGILLEIDNLVVYGRDGKQLQGAFDIVQRGLNSKPIIYLYNGGHDLSTLIHEFFHYHQCKKYVGVLSRQDWINFINIDKYAGHLEDIAYFISDVFLK